MTPGWPITPKIGIKSQANAHESILCSYYVIWTSYSNFGENDPLTPVTPNYPRLTFDSIIEVESIKLMYMHESYGHAMQYGDL